MSGRKLFAVGVAGLFLYLISPLLLPVVMGAVLAVLLEPWLEELERRRLPTSAASALLTVGLTLVVLLPTAFLIFSAIKTAFFELQALKPNPDAPPGTGDFVTNILTNPRIHSLIGRITEWFPISESEIVDNTRDLVGSVGLRLADLLGQAISHLPGMVLALAIIVVSVYFFLVDGRRLVAFVRRNTVFTEDETERLVVALAGICRSVILASVISGASQALVETVFCFATGTANAALIGILVFMGSFVPVIGSAPVTFGVAMQQFLLGRTAVAIILAIGGLVVMGLDNLVRPLFLRGTANLHPLLAFVAAFGGIQTLGFLGVFIGPIVAALFVATIRILLGGSSAPVSTPRA